MPGIRWYFALAIFFLLVVILSVPSDSAVLPTPEAARLPASGHSW